MNSKDVYTTGEVARICNVAPRTVSKWFDAGQLRGYRIPGSRDRRIPKAQLVRFMRAHGIPMEGLETGQTYMLVVDNDRDLTRVLRDSLEQDGTYEVGIASSAFEAGLLIGARAPHAMIVDVTLPDILPRELVRTIRASEPLQGMRVIGTSGGHAGGQGQGLIQQGFDAFLPKPFEIRELIALVENTASAV